MNKYEIIATSIMASVLFLWLAFQEAVSKNYYTSITLASIGFFYTFWLIRIIIKK